MPADNPSTLRRRLLWSLAATLSLIFLTSTSTLSNESRPARTFSLGLERAFAPKLALALDVPELAGDAKPDADTALAQPGFLAEVPGGHPAARPRALDHAVGQHRVGDLAEAGDVGAAHVVDRAVGLAVADALLVDAAHDVLQAFVDLLARPGDAQGVLRLLQARDGHAAGVGGLGRAVEDARVLEAVRSASLDLLTSLTPEEWERAGTHSESGAYSVTRWLEIYAGHSHDHANQIREARNRR